MSQSNLSINSSQGPITGFSLNVANSSNGWVSYLSTQLQNHNNSLSSYSPKTKVGLIIVVNAFFLLTIGSFVNMRERNNNAKSLENAPVNHFKSTLLLGGLIAVANIAFSKLLRYHLRLSTLCAISTSCVVIHLLLKKTVMNEQNVDLTKYLPNSADIESIKAAAELKRQEIEAEQQALTEHKTQLEEEQRQLQGIDDSQKTGVEQARLKEIEEIIAEIDTALQEDGELKQKSDQSISTLSDVAKKVSHSNRPSGPRTTQAAVVEELRKEFNEVSSPAAQRVRSRLGSRGMNHPLPVAGSAANRSITNLSKPVASRSPIKSPADSTNTKTSQPQQDGKSVLEATATKESLTSRFAWGLASFAGDVAVDAFKSKMSTIF